MTYQATHALNAGILNKTLARLALLSAATLIALLPGIASAATLQVCSTCPYTTIQSAVDAAASGDTIEIAPGTYSESVSISGAGSLLLTASSGRVTVDASGFDRALEILDPAANVTLQDLDLKDADGFAGLVNYGRATLVTVYVMSNSGTYGGIFNAGSLLTFDHSVIAGNTTTTLGSAGGLNNFAWVDLWNTTIIGNQGHEGGGFNSRGTSRVTVWSSSISGNQASSMGGGYFTSSPQAVVDIKPSSSFSSNSAPYCAKFYDVNQSPDCQ